VARSLVLPQIDPSVDDALALVCTIPSTDRGERRVSVAAVVQRARECRDIEFGVSLVFDPSAENAKLVSDLVLAERECCAQFTYTIVFTPLGGDFELRVEAAVVLVRPLKTLYLGSGFFATIDCCFPPKS
jgi:hypothetical protein